MRIEIRDPGKKAARCGAYVTFAREAAKGKKAVALAADEVREAAERALSPSGGADGSLSTASLAEHGPAHRLYQFGVGEAESLSPRKARTLLRSVAKTLGKNGERSAIVDFPFSVERMDASESREFVLRSLFLSAYAFDRYKSEKKKRERNGLDLVRVNGGRGPWEDVPARAAGLEMLEAAAIARVAALVRDVGNTPSSDLVPRQFAEWARKEGKSRDLIVKVLGRKEIEKERMGGLLAVSRGAEEEPRFVVMEYRGGPKGEPPVALVGKGVTFDSGGISIKPAEKMGEMKWDMMGAATVVGIVLAAADLGLPVNLVALAPLTENLPSGSAYKPGDIVRFRNGKTAEIDNTDAEGRVILADALDYAGAWKPSVILDFATLTGAAIVAVGFEAAVVFSPDDSLVAGLVAAGERTDERLWRLPLWDEYRDNIKSDWADMKNTGGRWGGAIHGAIFLKEFVPAGTPWAHLDIAPTANYDGERAGYPAGATAYGVALTLRWLRDRTALKKAADGPH